MKKTVENIVAKLRKDRRIRQEDLAEALGVTRQTIIALEKGNYRPSVELALKISEFFDICVNEIFFIKKK